MFSGRMNARTHARTRTRTHALVSWDVVSEDELPPGIPSATGLPKFWLRTSSSASVTGGGAGPPPFLQASAFFLLAE